MSTNGIGNAYAAQAAMQSAPTTKTKEPGKVTKPNGQKEIGKPQLSEKAQKYYDQLQKKFSNMDFILVSADKKDEAQANLSKFASNKSLVVLIDEEKIEKMAEDPAYREKYEKVLRGATTQFAQMKQDLGSNADSVKTFGMKVNDDGTASFFAVIDKSLASQKKRIEEKSVQKREDKKEAARQEQKKKLEESRTDNLKKKDEDTVTVTASSWNDLLKKITDTITGFSSDHVQTKEETWVGQKFDYMI
ncbi:MAG: hypothetical protein HFH41_04860 [Lachnospiraceae bacterium]|nr:hypothetical protein [Lachnospiraceae bacterium]